MTLKTIIILMFISSFCNFYFNDWFPTLRDALSLHVCLVKHSCIVLRMMDGFRRKKTFFFRFHQDFLRIYFSKQVCVVKTGIMNSTLLMPVFISKWFHYMCLRESDVQQLIALYCLNPLVCMCAVVCRWWEWRQWLQQQSWWWRWWVAAGVFPQWPHQPRGTATPPPNTTLGYACTRTCCCLCVSVCLAHCVLLTSCALASWCDE